MESIKIKIHSIKIASVVFCGCETWSVTLREEHRRKLLENRGPRKIFELKRDEIRGDRRKLHDQCSTVCVFMYF
jgi:hypothetical protein